MFSGANYRVTNQREELSYILPDVGWTDTGRKRSVDNYATALRANNFVC